MAKILGDERANKINGTARRDKIFGFGGDDDLAGRLGDDRISGGGGSDILIGDKAGDFSAGGDDTLLGGADTDVLGGGLGDDLLKGGDGLDFLFGGIIDAFRNDRGGILVSFGQDSGGGNDDFDGGEDYDEAYLFYADRSDSLNLHVKDALDTTYILENGTRVGSLTSIESITFYAGSGDDTLIFPSSESPTFRTSTKLYGNGGNDFLSSGRGSDLLDGGTGNDSLSGHGGDDVMIGGPGKDKLAGGPGATEFVFYNGDTGSSVGNADVITDFGSEKQDHIDLSGIDADTTTLARDAFAFIATAEFSNTAGELRYEIAGGETAVLADTDGDGRADMVIRISGAIELTETDFRLGAAGAFQASNDGLMIINSAAGSFRGELVERIMPAEGVYV